MCLSEIPAPYIFNLFASASMIRNFFKGDRVELCSIINAKSGACTEDCSFCAQSSRSKAEIEVYPLLDKKTVLQKALEAKKSGVKRFSIVTGGRKVSDKNLTIIADIISEIRGIGLLPCASLGLLSKDELLMLKTRGLERYHHNIESSERFFPQICTTHTYEDKIKTIEAAKSVGLSICSGGIFGLGEGWQDRIDMAFGIKELDADSVPINFFIPIKGTPLGEKGLLHPFEALKIISIFRYILPEKDLRVCGGRMQVLGDFHSLIFLAGADCLMTGNYLTTQGRSPEDDLNLIETYGLSI